jgi:hypothetical protein
MKGWYVKMIKIENAEVFGWEAAIRGMRNPLNSWEKSDSYWTHVEDPQTHETANYAFFVGDADKELMMKLAKGGSVHAKYRRMINVTVDITAPLYWWKEFDTYKVGTVANSCSTMHKIHSKEFTVDDFSGEHLEWLPIEKVGVYDFKWILDSVIRCLNMAREMYIKTKDKRYWYQMIQLLPSSYNQKRTIQMNYEVLCGMYRDRKNHKLLEWVELCKWIETLPHSEVITCG